MANLDTTTFRAVRWGCTLTPDGTPELHVWVRDDNGEHLVHVERIPSHVGYHIDANAPDGIDVILPGHHLWQGNTTSAYYAVRADMPPNWRPPTTTTAVNHTTEADDESSWVCASCGQQQEITWDDEIEDTTGLPALLTITDDGREIRICDHCAGGADTDELIDRFTP